ncbi:MAG TPA: inositol monophosphatase family protein [Gemmatimonadales bacterium]|nr:inositol monophosphatase family protein [Gemmatimonadales bacterium]
MLEHHNLVRAAESAARRAADHIRRARTAPPTVWDTKGPRDFVSAVDREAERLIGEVLRSAYPDSVILGEELSPTTDVARAPATLLWIVDPLDGTANYLHGYPQYAVSIAAVVDGELVAGVVLDVERNRLYRAAAAGGAWCDDARLSVSHVGDPGLALIGTGFPFRTPDLVPRYLRQFTAINGMVSGIRRAGSASLDLVDVALGRLDGFWELRLAPWDVAAGTVIVREAGGVVSDDAGAPDVLKHGAVVAGNPAMHAWLLKVVEEY